MPTRYFVDYLNKQLSLKERKSFIIGRGRGSDILLDDLSVSRRHAGIEWIGGQFVVRDMNSTNGTKVNGTALMEHALADGDRIQVGDFELYFRVQNIDEAGSSDMQTIQMRADRPDSD